MLRHLCLQKKASAWYVVSGVDAPLSTYAHVFDSGAQAGVQTAACGDAALPQQQQEKNTWQVSGDTFYSTGDVASPGRCPGRWLRRCDSAAAGEEHSVDE
jgi:chitinase